MKNNVLAPRATGRCFKIIFPERPRKMLSMGLS